MGTTTNYGWVQPTVGGDADTWGNELNTTLQNIDTTVKAVSDSIPVAATVPAILQSGAVTLAATFLSLDLSSFLTYKRLEIKLNRVNPGLASLGAGIQFSLDAGATFLATGYNWTLATLGETYVGSDDATTGDTTQIKIQDRHSFLQGTIGISIGIGAIVDSMIAGGGTHASWIGGGEHTVTGINGVKLYTIGGTVLSGFYDLIGYK